MNSSNEPLEFAEVFFSKGTNLGVEFDKGGSILLPVDKIVDGEHFSQRFVIETDFDEKTWQLTLSWSPSRSGDERIPWNELDGKIINAREHPLYGTKNEQAGLYHATLPAGCYICREEACV